MITNINNIPVYSAEINSDTQGIDCVSFVSSPATDVNLLKFSKIAPKMKYSIMDKNSRKIIAPIMRANFPIYRKDNINGEYYVVFQPITIEKMVIKMLKDGTINNFNSEHIENKIVTGVDLVEIFIKNDEKGLSPKNFEDVENGSLFGIYVINNQEVWEKIIKGEYAGISIEGFFDLKQVSIEKEEDNDTDELADLEEIAELLKECRNKGIN